MRKKHHVKLIVQDKAVEKAWAAVKLLTKYSQGMRREGSVWVSIEKIGDFLRKRQIDAAKVKFDDNDPNTRYALAPDPVEPRKWDDHTIVSALNDAVNKGLLLLIRTEERNYFRPKNRDPRDKWKLQDTSTPDRRDWRPQELRI